METADTMLAYEQDGSLEDSVEELETYLCEVILNDRPIQLQKTPALTYISLGM